MEDQLYISMGLPLPIFWIINNTLMTGGGGGGGGGEAATENLMESCVCVCVCVFGGGGHSHSLWGHEDDLISMLYEKIRLGKCELHEFLVTLYPTVDLHR